MEKNRKNKWFLRVLALVMALGLLIGAVPVAAVADGEQPDGSEPTVASSEEETQVVDEQPSNGDQDVQPEPATEAENVSDKSDADLAETAAEPGEHITADDVTVNVYYGPGQGDYTSYNDRYYTGISYILVEFPVSKLPYDQLDAVFIQGIDPQAKYGDIAWFHKYGDENYKKCVTPSYDVMNKVMRLRIDVKVYAELICSSNFADKKADGTYSLIFPYDVDDENEPVLYRREFVIDNEAPSLDLDAGNIKGWKSEDVEVNFASADFGSGLDNVTICEYTKPVKTYLAEELVESRGTYKATETASYQIYAEDKLGNKTEMRNIGSIKIDKNKINFGDNTITYDKAAPGSDEWTKDEVKASFTVNQTESGIRSIKVKGTNTDAVHQDENTFAVTFTDAKPITVVATTKAGLESELEIAPPQIDMVDPDKNSIDHIGITSIEKSKTLNLLTFGLYDNRDLLFTVYAKDGGSPITEINIDNKYIEKNGNLIIDEDGTAHQSFKITAKKISEWEDFLELKISLKDAAGNTTKEDIPLTSIDKITIDKEDTITEFNGEEFKEHVKINLVPDVELIKITSDKSGVSGYYKNNIKVEAKISEPLHGLSSIEAYFGPVDAFIRDEAKNELKPTKDAANISDSISAIDPYGSSDEATLVYSVPDDTPAGAYIVLVKAYNGINNYYIKEIVFNIDKDAPDIELGATPDTWTKDPDTKITFTVNDKPADNNVGVKTVTVKSVDSDNNETDQSYDQDESGVYFFTPEAGKRYKFSAEDNYDNQKDGVITEVKFDNKAPNISPFTYDGNENNTKWGNEVTVRFTVDDKFGGKTLSGVNESSFTLKKVLNPGTDEETEVDTDAVITAKKDESDESVYNCSFTVTDNNAAYVVRVKDIADNEAKSITDTIKRDDTVPKIEKIVFSSTETNKKFGVYSDRDIVATVYVTGGAAPIKDIRLYNGEQTFDPVQGNENVSVEGEYSVKSFIIRASQEGSSYSQLGAYAESEAGVHTQSDNKGIVSISSINVYIKAGDEEQLLEKFADFFEAVAKSTGPAIEINLDSFLTVKNNARGYLYGEDNSIINPEFRFAVDDQIAGIEDGAAADKSDKKIAVYYDKIENFTLDSNGEYHPNESARKVEDGNIVLDHVKDDDQNVNANVKNTHTDGTGKETEARESGEYVICVEAWNLAGAKNTKSEAFYIDNSVPVISDVKYEPETSDTGWTDNDVTVSFKVTDLPDTYNGGVDTASVKVTGAIDKKDYTVIPAESGDMYSFTTGIAQEYIISAQDNFSYKADNVTTNKIYVDKEEPNITVINPDSYKSDWSPKEKTITFTVNDISDYDGYNIGDEENKLLSGISSIKVKGADGKEYSIKGADGTVYEYGKAEATAEQRTYTFVADLYQNYTIEVTDNAKHTVKNTELTDIAVDIAEPYITNVSFAKKQPTVVEKMLNFLTFGIFSNDTVVMTVEAEDPYASSGMKSITVSGLAANSETKEVKGGKPEASTMKAGFDIKPYQIKSSTEISFISKDMVDLESKPVTLAQLYNDGKITLPKGFSFNDEKFKFVVSEAKAEIGPPTLSPGVENTLIKQDEEGAYWYSNDVRVEYEITDETSYIHSIDVTINGHSVRDYITDVTDGKEVKVPEKYTEFDSSANMPDVAGNNTTPVSKRTIRIDTEKIREATAGKTDLCRIFNKDSQKNELVVTVRSNNGEKQPSKPLVIYLLDDQAPDITEFEFSNTIEPDGSTEAKKEAKAISDALKEEGFTRITDDNYIYFFKDSAQLTVDATDTHILNGKELNGTGVKKIELIGVGQKDADSSIQNYTFEAKSSKTYGIGNMEAAFEIPAGFKGSIFARAIDNVENVGSYYSPNNLVVENSLIHDASSGTKLEINTKPAGTDNNGHDLFNGDVELTFTVEDRYSGINTITYTADGLESGAHMSVNVTVDINGSNNDGWTVVDKDERNLVYKMTKTITLDGFGAFNSNDIRITVTGKDRSGFTLAESEKTISIDTDKPEIEVTYDPTAGSGNTYGSDAYEYFKVDRIMYVTVYERNFDPEKFDYSGIVNSYVSGDVPALVAGEDWSTSYSTYTGKPAHKASFTFANDGDYDISLKCTDEATNVSDEYVGEKFTIDKVDPTTEVSLSGTVKNGKYYNETVTATITVHEHNFAEGDGYVTFTPKTSFDTSYDKSSSTPTLSAWSSSGDTHTATATFSSDGTYSFTFDYKDKSTREATQLTQAEFVIDKNAENMITFIDVDNEKAYNKEIAPKVNFDDTNLNTVTTTLTRINIDAQAVDASGDLAHSWDTSTGPKRTESYESFPEVVGNDGIYKYHAEGTDMAGNSAEKDILFSVNRFGSTFMLSEASAKWIETGYTQVSQNLEIIEINVNEVTDQAVAVSLNSKTNNLERNSGFTLSSGGSADSWYRYDYNIKESNFASEGDYTVTVSSTDAFKKTWSNRTAYVSDDAENEEDKVDRTCPVSFVIDRTLPEVSIEGVESGKPYGDPERDVKIVCIDNNIDAGSLVITNENGEALQKDVDYTVDELAGELDIELTVSNAGKHSLSVAVNDFAENVGESQVIDFTLNASIFTLFFYNTTAVICTSIGLAAVIALAVFLVLKKRKKTAAK